VNKLPIWYVKNATTQAIQVVYNTMNIDHFISDSFLIAAMTAMHGK
jgi:hypothetical protein